MSKRNKYKPKAKNETALKTYIKDANTKSKAGHRRGNTIK